MCLCESWQTKSCYRRKTARNKSIVPNEIGKAKEKSTAEKSSIHSKMKTCSNVPKKKCSPPNIAKNNPATFRRFLDEHLSELVRFFCFQNLFLIFFFFLEFQDLKKNTCIVSLTSYPRKTAIWKESSCIGITVRTPWRQSTVWGTST